MDWSPLGSPCSPRDSQESSPTLKFKSINSSVLAFFTVQLSHPYMTTGKTIALTRWTFLGKVMSLLLNMLSRLVITFLPRSKRLLISWLQSPSAVIKLIETSLSLHSNTWADCLIQQTLEDWIIMCQYLRASILTNRLFWQSQELTVNRGDLSQILMPLEG